MFRIAPVALAFLLAGCFGLGCHVDGYAAEWQEPGLFNALLASGTGHHIEVSGFAWNRSDLDAQFGDRYAATFMQRDHGELRFMLWPSGDVSVLAPAGTNASAIAAQLEQVTAADVTAAAQKLADGIAAKVAAGEVGGSHSGPDGAQVDVYGAQAILPGPFILDAVAGQEIRWYHGNGHIRGDWDISIRLETIAFEGSRGSATVFASDVVIGHSDDTERHEFNQTMQGLLGAELQFREFEGDVSEICVD